MLALQETMDDVSRFAEKVAPIYKLLGWRWGGITNGRVPDAKEIESTLLGMIVHVERLGTVNETGGLRVERTPRGTYIMSFRVEHWVGIGSTYNAST